MSAALLLTLGLLGIFLALTLALSIVGAITRERVAVQRSLTAVQAVQTAPKEMQKELDRPFQERVVGPSMDRLTGIARRFTPQERTDRLKKKLALAGSPAGWDVDRILAFKALGALLGLGIGFFVPLALGWSALWVLLLPIGLGILGWYMPDLVLYQAAYNRSEQIRKELPNALDLLTISVEAGLGFDAALSQVARNTEGPLADEFFRVLQEMQIGVGRPEALRALAERTDVPALRGFVTAMVQADAYGVPIANVLRVQAREMRIKRSQQVEEAAQKVPVKLLFPLIFCILPVLFIVILGPAVIRIVEAFTSV